MGLNEKELESEARRRAIVDNAVDGIITIDEAGSIADLNRAVEGLFGYAPDELIGKNVKILMPEPYQGEHDTYLRNYRETGQRKIRALSIPTAKVIVNWQINDHGWLHVHWAERDGPQVRPPDRSGFGRLLLERA